MKAPNGALQIVVRGTDGYVYRTGQTTPGATTWLPWQEITGYTEQTAIDPTVSLAQDTWVIGYRTADGNPKLRRFQGSSGSAATRSMDTFVDVPLRAPAK